MPQGRAAHFGAGAVLVAVKRQKVAALFYRKAKPPRPGDETQVVDVPVSIIAKAIVAAKWGDEADILRSEEHTSELQSLMRISYAVFCLKNKKKDKSHMKT